jgi:hypothetical protein
MQINWKKFIGSHLICGVWVLKRYASWRVVLFRSHREGESNRCWEINGKCHNLINLSMQALIFNPNSYFFLYIVLFP